VTSDLARRVFEHRSDAVASFTRKYGVHTLVYAEFHDTMADAILREKRIKRWPARVEAGARRARQSAMARPL
jgi:putative endonuclease